MKAPGTIRAGVQAPTSRAPPTLATMATAAATSVINGNAETGNADKNTESRNALAATICAIMSPEPSMATPVAGSRPPLGRNPRLLLGDPSLMDDNG